MVIMIYIGILLLCYGIYNTFCYFFMLPTAKAGKYSSVVGQGQRLHFTDLVSIEVSDRLVRKFELKWNRSEEVGCILTEKGIYVEATVFLIGKLFLFLAGVVILLPIFFMDKIIFWMLLVLWLINRILDTVKILPWKQGQKEKRKQKIIIFCCKLLPGAFLIAQILVFLSWLT